jgi:hypothetical protein
VELRHRQLVGLDEQGRAAGVRPTGHRLALRASGAANDDEARVTRRVLGRRLLVERSRRATDEVAESRARGVENDVPGRLVARHLESVDDLGRDERPGLGADPMHAIFETKRELSRDDEQRLGMSCMDVEGGFSPTGSGAHVDRAELLDVHEEPDVELLAAEDDLALADLDHVPAA